MAYRVDAAVNLVQTPRFEPVPDLPPVETQLHKLVAGDPPVLVISDGRDGLIDLATGTFDRIIRSNVLLVLHPAQVPGRASADGTRNVARGASVCVGGAALTEYA
jgi:hypothetical protein